MSTNKDDPSTYQKQPGEYSSELPQQQVRDIERQQGKDFSAPDPAIADHKKSEAHPTQPPTGQQQD